MSNLSKAKVRRVIERDKWACAYCGNPVSEQTVRMDHVLAKSKGGSSKDENLVASCARCNGLKWDYSMERFLERISEKYAAASEEAEHFAKILRRANETIY